MVRKRDAVAAAGPPGGRRRGELRRWRHLRRAEAELLLAHLSRRLQERLVHATGCAACQALLRALLRPAAAPRRGDGEEAAATRHIAAALNAAARLEAGNGGDADGVAAAALLATPRGTHARRIRHEARFRTPGVAGHLLARAHAAASPRRAETCALLAVRVVEAIDRAEAPARVLGELAAQAWGVVARARWRRNDPIAVREALEHAERALVAAGWPDAHRGFRPALRGLRLVERRLADAAAAAAHALHQLLEAPPAAAAAESGHEALEPPLPGGALPENDEEP
jgi:hypothetical protein